MLTFELVEVIQSSIYGRWSDRSVAARGRSIYSRYNRLCTLPMYTQQSVVEFTCCSRWEFC